MPRRARAGSRPEQVLRTLDERHVAAETANDLRDLDPDRTTAQDDQVAGTAFMLVASRLRQTPDSSRSPGIGGVTGSAPVATTTCVAV